MNIQPKTNYFYFISLLLVKKKIALAYSGQIFHNFALKEDNYPQVIRCADVISDLKPYQLKSVWIYGIQKSYRMLQSTHLHVDFKDTMEFFLTLTSTKIGLVAPISIPLSNFLALQLQLIKNKRMQIAWLKRISLQLSLYLKFSQFTLIRTQNLISFYGLNIILNGRAADLRWVKSRSLDIGKISKTGKKIQNAKEWFSSDYFVTKWGSISLTTKVQINQFV